MFVRSGRAAAAAVAVTLAGAGLLVAAGPAYAVPFPFTDSFEGVPADRWVADAVPGQTTVRLGDDARARTGTKLASLNAGPLVPSTARIYRTVTPDSTQPLPFSCALTPWPTGTITVEISAYHGTAFVDDLTFRCYEI